MGLGDAFLDEFENTLARIVAEPERGPKVHGRHRKLNFHRFPSGIVYSVEAVTLFGLRYFSTPSAARHRNQAAVVVCGRQRSPNLSSSFGLGMERFL